MRREGRERPEGNQLPEERLLALLAKRGFRLVKKNVQIPSEGLRHGPRFDFLLRRGGQQFAVEVKAARGFADWFFHWLARPILVLQAARRLRGWEPLLGIYVDYLEPQAVQRFRAQAHVYAPELWWVVADAKGSVVSHLPDRDEEHVQASLEQGEIRSARRAGIIFASEPGIISRGSRSYGAGEAAPKLSFGDLDQWLIKVLVFAPSQAHLWGGPRGHVRNPLQLAKLAEVSPPLVYRWAAAMEVSGYLEKRPRRVLSLRNPDGLLAEWRGRYRLDDNERIPCKPIFAQRVDEPYVKEFLGLLRKMKGSAQSYALSGHQACRFYRARHSAARSIHLYVRENLAVLMEALQLAPDPSPAAPIVLLLAKHRRSVFGGAARIDGVVVCDVLQVYLDLYHLHDRGREQADFLYDRVVGPLLRAAAEARHAL
jgi:hypothetical protein